MQWICAKVTFSHSDQNLCVDLIADIFDTLGIQGVVVDDPFLEPDEGWGTDAVPRPVEPAVSGYFPADEHLKKRQHKLEAALSTIELDQPLQYAVAYTTIDEEDWAESWKAFFYPEQITPTFVVKPTWRDYTCQTGQQIIEIDPGMAFGTGTHPTTALCIELLEKYVRPNHCVLDVGTGSGILLIAAAKLGADRLTGVDLDPVAIEVARSNLLHNRIDPNRFQLSCADLVATISKPYDVVVANILADVVIDLLDDVPTVLAPGGVFICSGIIQAYREKVADKMAACGFSIDGVRDRGEWVAISGYMERNAH